MKKAIFVVLLVIMLGLQGCKDNQESISDINQTLLDNPDRYIVRAVLNQDNQDVFIGDYQLLKVEPYLIIGMTIHFPEMVAINENDYIYYHENDELSLVLLIDEVYYSVKDAFQSNMITDQDIIDSKYYPIYTIDLIVYVPDEIAENRQAILEYLNKDIDEDNVAYYISDDFELPISEINGYHFYFAPSKFTCEEILRITIEGYTFRHDCDFGYYPVKDGIVYDIWNLIENEEITIRDFYEQVYGYRLGILRVYK